MSISTLAPPTQAWPFPGIGTAAGWAERLVAMSLSRTARRGSAARGFSPAESARPAPSLTAAIAAIVAVAAQRARATGDLPALRDAIDRALDSADLPADEDPREQGMAFLAPISDAAGQEGGQLMSLMQRQR
jgi:hypothetical protein